MPPGTTISAATELGSFESPTTSTNGMNPSSISVASHESLTPPMTSLCLIPISFMRVISPLPSRIIGVFTSARLRQFASSTTLLCFSVASSKTASLTFLPHLEAAPLPSNLAAEPSPLDISPRSCSENSSPIFRSVSSRVNAFSIVSLKSASVIFLARFATAASLFAFSRFVGGGPGGGGGTMFLRISGKSPSRDNGARRVFISGVSSIKPNFTAAERSACISRYVV